MDQKLLTLLQNATGKVVYPLTNDYLFHAVFQKNETVLKGLVASLLSLNISDIQSIIIKNPILLGEALKEKDIVLDLNIELNDNQILNIEMQVINYLDWTERSLYYLCRSFCNLHAGDSYLNIMPVIHIGILDFTLFSDSPEFYTRNLLSNIKTHQIYSSKLALHVLDLTQIELATQEDKACGLEHWAALFKAKTWEELKMVAEKNKSIEQAVVTMYELSEDEKIRMQCEARRIREMDEKSHLYAARLDVEKKYAPIIAAKDKVLAENAQALSEKDQALAEKDQVLAEKDQVLAEKETEILALKKLLGKTD